MRTLSLIALLIATGCGKVPQPKAKLSEIDSVIAMQQQDDGSYRVICRDNTFEVISAEDLLANNVCPNHRSEPLRLPIASLQARQDGNFDVVCTDGRKEVASQADILDGDVCKVEIPSPGHRMLAAGGWHNCVLEDGKVTCWGSDTEGRSTPPSGLKAKAISMGGWHSCALKEDNTVTCWGLNKHGQVNVPEQYRSNP